MANEWDEIGERLHGLGGKLKTHFDESGPNQWPDALNKLGAAVEDLFKTASNAVQDENVRSDVRDVGHLIAGAVSTTLGTASSEIREWLDSRRGGSSAEGTSPEDRPADGGPADGGPAEGGPAEGGPADGGPAEGGPADGGPADGGPAGGGPADGGPADGGPADGGPAGGGPADGGADKPPA